MLERQREGVAKAKAAGKYKGRPISIDAAQIRQLRAELGPAAIAKRLGIDTAARIHQPNLFGPGERQPRQFHKPALGWPD
jgi:DNA invertase Pin-like site-specific DNA recombinase